MVIRAMNTNRINCLMVMLVLTIIGFGPVSLTCLIGFYVIAARPGWFLHTMRGLYRDKVSRSEGTVGPLITSSSGAARVKSALVLLLLLMLDIAPIPVAGIVGLYIVLARPMWFMELVRKIYATQP